MHKLLQNLVWLVIRLLISTYKTEVRGLEHREKAKKLSPNGSFIFVMWHEQVISCMNGHRNTEPYLALASRSKDGDYAAFVARKMGFTPVRGSSNKKRQDKGGKEAMAIYVDKLKEGISGGITVDGPKGPRHKCKPGAVVMAKLTGASILPVVGVAARYWEFNSWDKFKIPKPFSKIILCYGAPIQIEADASDERVNQICEEVNQALIKLTEANSK